MGDLEMTKLCAKAMGIELFDYVGTEIEHQWRMGDTTAYWPLAYDAQAMELVRRFEISIAWSWTGQVGCMSKREAQRDEEKRHDNISCTYKNLNRAIVECVAKMQAAKVAA